MEVLIPTSNLLHLPPHRQLFFSPSKITTTLSFNTYKKKKQQPYRIPKLTANAPATAVSARASSLLDSPSAAPPSTSRWLVAMEQPPNGDASSRAEAVDYYVQTLARVLPSEKEAQMCIYQASWQTDFFFCCDIEEEASRELARMPGVRSVSPDRNMEESINDFGSLDLLLGHQSNSSAHFSKFSPSVGNCDRWLVKMDKPGVEVVTEAQMVDYFAQTLAKVLGKQVIYYEKDAQVSIYNITWEKDFGFCCQIDEECARELSDVPGVLFVEPDVNFESENKNYKVDDMLSKKTMSDDSPKMAPLTDVKTKRLFVTGLSFYTSEKTLRAAFEPFGELVEVKIIMDKISKRSKGYAFIEYTTEAAAGKALKEMNGKIINGWMIVVDVAKTNPPKHNRGRPWPPLNPSSSTY